MFHLHGEAERCKTLPSLLQDVLFPVYKSKLIVFLLVLNGIYRLKKKALNLYNNKYYKLIKY